MDTQFLYIELVTQDRKKYKKRLAVNNVKKYKIIITTHCII